MKYVWLAALVSGCTCTGPLLAQLPPPGDGVIEGRVVNAVTGAPVRRAIITLYTPPSQLIAETDTDGRFQFTALPAGRYHLSVSRIGFLPRSNAAKRSIVLGQDGYAKVDDILLAPQSVISGRVLDEEGDPILNADVVALERSRLDGKGEWLAAAGGMTNDRGEYRIPNLAPGRYLLKALPRQAGPIFNTRYSEDIAEPDKTEMVYLPVYYPNATDPSAAAPVQVGAGAEVQGIDIHIFRSPSFHVHGKFERYVTSGSSRSTVVLFSLSDNKAKNDGVVDGLRFDIPNVLPGRYMLIADAGDGHDQLSGSQLITVAGNVNDITVPLSKWFDLSVNLSVVQTGGQVKLQGTDAILNPLSYSSKNVRHSRADMAGKYVFTISPVVDHYEVAVRPIPEGCFIQKVTLDGREVAVDDVEIRAPGVLNIILSNTAGKITASVVDKDGQPDANAIVTLIPSEKDQPALAYANDDGAVTFNNLPPGAYKLFAWARGNPGAYKDPEFRKQYEDQAVDVTVGPSETKTAQLHSIVAGEIK